MKSSARLVFFGTEDFSGRSLEALVKFGWDVAAVVTKPDSKSGRGQKNTPPTVKTIAQKHGIPVLQPANLHRIVYEIASLEATHGVLASFGKIIPASLIDIFPGGIVNVHPSLLPKYRGPSPIETAILNGDTETGISLMQLTPEMDEGPVYAAKKVVIHDGETAPELEARLADYGAAFLAENLNAIVDGSLQPELQDDSQASYSHLLKKSDGRIDWTKSAEAYEREIRAYLLYPKSSAKVHGQEIIITKARVVKNESGGQLVMPCQPGYLDILELIGPSGKRMTGADFVRGYSK